MCQFLTPGIESGSQEETRAVVSSTPHAQSESLRVAWVSIFRMSPGFSMHTQGQEPLILGEDAAWVRGQQWGWGPMGCRAEMGARQTPV